jgi:hypothetical protein
VILANVGYNTSYIQNLLIVTVLLNKEISGNTSSVIDRGSCINKEILFSVNKDADFISK